MSNKSHARGASASLKLTISDLKQFMKNGKSSPVSGKLRSKLEEIIADHALRYYKKGFNRAHRLSYEEFQANKKVPRRLVYEASRKTLGPNQTRKIRASSKIKS